MDYVSLNYYTSSMEFTNEILTPWQANKSASLKNYY